MTRGAAFVAGLPGGGKAPAVLAGTAGGGTVVFSAARPPAQRAARGRQGASGLGRNGGRRNVVLRGSRLAGERRGRGRWRRGDVDQRLFRVGQRRPRRVIHVEVDRVAEVLVV